MLNEHLWNDEIHFTSSNKCNIAMFKVATHDSGTHLLCSYCDIKTYKMVLLPLWVTVVSMPAWPTNSFNHLLTVHVAAGAWGLQLLTNSCSCRSCASLNLSVLSMYCLAQSTTSKSLSGSYSAQVIKSPWYTGGDFMFLYRFVRRRRHRPRWPQILVHAIIFE